VGSAWSRPSPTQAKMAGNKPIRAHSINIEINFAFCEILQFEAKQIMKLVPDSLPEVSFRLNE
jgi:hypothetical protein